MRRYQLATLAPDASGALAPSLSGSWVVLATRGSWALCKVAVADGIAPDSQTIADLDSAHGAGDVAASALSAGQKSAIKTWLTNNGFDVSQFDGDNPNTRRKLLLYILCRQFGWSAADVPKALTGYDVFEGVA